MIRAILLGAGAVALSACGTTTRSTPPPITASHDGTAEASPGCNQHHEVAMPAAGKIQARKSSRNAKPFEFHLTEGEANEIRHAKGEGGHQALHRRLVAELDQGLTVTFDDAELGELIRYMTQYKSGGFQDRLRAAFERSLKEQLGFQSLH